MKNIFLLASLVFSINAFAQTPSYVPTNGLVAWWPFTGNANDGSGNGNNGTVNGATLATDRIGNTNAAYHFNGSSYIDLPSLNFTSDFTVSLWLNADALSLQPCGQHEVFSKATNSQSWPNGHDFGVNELGGFSVGNGSVGTPSVNLCTVNNWYHIVYSYSISTQTMKLYCNGNLVSSASSFIVNNYNTPIRCGARPNTVPMCYFIGNLDDIGIWNRAITQQEITDLYNAVNCANNTTITPQTNSLTIGSTATFTASTLDPNPSYVWQSDFGQGFQTLNNFGNYSGVNSATFNIANVQLSEHNQPIRVISTSGNCVDTSNIATINITDTCIVTINDTITTLISVTDTLIINATITGLTPPNNLNTIKVFPNPANDHITINYGNFASMSGYTLKITNNLGQVVFTSPINQQSSYIDLSTWSGNGIYFVQLIDPQNNTIENRKIVIQ